jgi:hypothetical protein
MRPSHFICISLILGVFLGLLFPSREQPTGSSSGANSSAKNRSTLAPQADSSSESRALRATDPAFETLPVGRQAEAIQRFSARLAGAPTPSDLSVVLQILEPLDWNASRALWEQVENSGTPGSAIHPEILALLAEHLAKLNPHETLKLSIAPPDSRTAGFSPRLYHAAFSLLLHRDAATALQTYAELPAEHQHEQLIKTISSHSKSATSGMFFGKIGGSFAETARTVLGNPKFFRAKNFTPVLLSALALQETDQPGAAFERMRVTAEQLFSSTVDLTPEVAAEARKHFLNEAQENLQKRGLGRFGENTGTSETPEEHGMSVAIKAFRAGRESGIQAAISTIPEAALNDEVYRPLVGALAGAYLADPSRTVAEVEKIPESPLRRNLINAFYFTDLLVSSGTSIDEMLASVWETPSRLQLPPGLAFDFLAAYMDPQNQDGLLSFLFGKDRISQNSLIATLPLTPEQKAELKRRFPVIPLEK